MYMVHNKHLYLSYLVTHYFSIHTMQHIRKDIGPLSRLSTQPNYNHLYANYEKFFSSSAGIQTNNLAQVLLKLSDIFINHNGLFFQPIVK